MRTNKIWSFSFLLAALLIALLPSAGPAQASGLASKQAQVVDPLENPPWPDQCELKITIILDHSNSIARADPANPSLMQNAAKNLVDTLAGKLAEVSIVSFWDTAETMIPLTPLDSPENVETVKTAVDFIQFFTTDERGSTNWEAAFKEASLSASVTEDPRKPADAIIVLTDGEPTTYGYPGDDLGDGAEVDQIDIDRGVEGANTVKAEGTRVIAVGIGGLFDAAEAEQNLQLISGPTQNEDYFLAAEFELLDETLQSIAARICAIRVDKSADPELIESGDPVTYSYLVTNPGDLPVSDVSLTDDTCEGVEFVGGDDDDGALNADETWEYTCGTSLLQDTLNIATVTGQVDGFPVADQDDALVDVRPLIEVVKIADPVAVAEPGGTVEFTIRVTNISQEEATLISLMDDPFGDLTSLPSSSCALVPLAPDVPYVCSFSGEISGEAGDIITDTLTAEATDDEGNLAQDSDSASVEITAPALDIFVEKTNDADGDSVFNDLEQAPAGGSTVTFRVVVQNSGDRAVEVLNITDDLHGADGALTTASGFSPDCAELLGSIIPPPDSSTCYFDGVIADMENLVEVNTVEVTVADAEPDVDSELTRSDTSTVTTPDLLPEIKVKKKANKRHIPETGAEVTFHVRVVNLSPEPVTLEALEDDVFGDLNGQGSCAIPQTLAADGGAYRCAFRAFLASDDLTPHVDVVTAVARDDEGNSATDSDDERVTFFPVKPSICLHKLNDANQDGVFTDDEIAPESGALVTFQVTINNHTNETLTLTRVSDDLHPFTLADCPTTEIAPFDSLVCTYQGRITEKKKAVEVNTARARVEDNEGDFAFAMDTSTVRTPGKPKPKKVGVGSPGFWKNHPDAWPVAEITIGEVLYARSEAIEIMSAHEKGDKTYSMFRALLAAKLNLLVGTEPTCIAETVEQADEWMANYGPPGSGVAGSSSAWEQGEPIKDRLDAYNNGRLCAPSN
jgi:uncharacterized repeat protein (TIGR01451 family)